MSRCFTWFPISGLEEPNILHQLDSFTSIGDFTWMGFVLTFMNNSYKRIYSPDQSSDIMCFINYFNYRFKFFISFIS